MIKTNNKAVLYIICSIVCGAIVSCGNVFAEDVTYEVDVATGINITIPTNTVTLNLTPTNVASFKSSDLPVTVKTNNPTGYTLTMSPSDDTTTDLTRTGGTETIPTLADLSGGYTEQTFTTNKWGYKLSSTNYLPFATSNEITTTNAPTAASGNTSTVTFAAKGDTTLMSGAYNLEITFTAVANRVPVTWDMAYANAGKTKYNGYYKMQDATSAICTAVDMNEIGEVIDARDNEVYKVGKLADNKCWILDNLRLDLGNSTVLASTTTDNTNASTTSLNFMKNGGGTTSDQYPTAPINNEAWTSAEQDYYSIPMTISMYKDQTTTSYGAGSGKIGVYYNFCAASAGSYCYGDGTSPGTPSGDATEDICPKGWRIPTGSSITYANRGEYEVLTALITGSESSIVSGTDVQTALSTPLSGRYENGSASFQGSYGSFWASTKYSTYSFDILRVTSSDVAPRDYCGRSCGMSVRCVFGS